MNSFEISIIIQGPYIEETSSFGFSTLEVIKSARKYYPDSEIIYSGWEGTILNETFKEICNKIVLSADPGILKLGYYNGIPLSENTNRQIISTINGLKASSNKFCIKSRSDSLFFKNTPFNVNINSNSKIFRHPLFISESFTRIYFFEFGKIQPCICHISDLIHAGFKEDMIKYWSGKLIESAEYEYKSKVNCPAPEQLLFTRFLINNKIYNVKSQILTRFQTQIGHLNFNEFKSFVANNFQIMNEKDFGIILPIRFDRTEIEKKIFINNKLLHAINGEYGTYLKIKTKSRNMLIFLLYFAKNLIKPFIGENMYSMLYKTFTRP